MPRYSCRPFRLHIYYIVKKCTHMWFIALITNILASLHRTLEWNTMIYLLEALLNTTENDLDMVPWLTVSWSHSACVLCSSHTSALHCFVSSFNHIFYTASMPGNFLFSFGRGWVQYMMCTHSRPGTYTCTHLIYHV